MAVYRDRWNGYSGDTWRVACWYTDWQGHRRKHDKRGFSTKREAAAYEKEYIARKSKDINMGFATYLDIYLEDIRPQIKESTYLNKINIINKHIRPYFQRKSLSNITATDVLMWQNELLTLRDDQGKGYTQTYLRTINNQLTAMMNHAVRYYDLPTNPCSKNRKMGKSKAREMLFWTKSEYLRFSNAIRDKPISYYAFEILYWTGMRCGEMLALTREDVDLARRTIRVNKTYQVLNGKATITSPKSEKSNRIIDIPQFLADEMEEYFDSLYKVDPKSRIFQVTKSFLHHEMDRGAVKAGVKRIRIHDLRHSCCALLIDLGYAPIQIAERLGHESVTITERYAHLYPSVQRQMADKLDTVFRKEGDDG